MSSEIVPRNRKEQIIKDLSKKMVFIAGPRQTGKTTLSKSILTELGGDIQKSYLNWDFDKDREIILRGEFPFDNQYLILDEIHKFSGWRNTVKGIFDKFQDSLSIIVTGSARLEHYSHGGDSLQGRYFMHRLHPLTVKELKIDQKKDLDHLFNLSGFPEPFLSGSKIEQERWSRSYRSLLINQDLRDLEQVKDISKIELLCLRLPELVSSPLSINNLAGDLSSGHDTVTNWLNILEQLYFCFRIHPFQGSLVKSIRKQAKHYHYDWSLVKDKGASFENFIASHLLKWIHYQQDIFGKNIELMYFRDIEKREIDFLIVENQQVTQAIECKYQSREIDTNLKYFKKKYPKIEAIQVVYDLDDSFINQDQIKVLSALDFLNTLV